MAFDHDAATGFRAEVAIERRPTDPERASDRMHRPSLGTHRERGSDLVLVHPGWTTTRATAGSRRLEARNGALADQAALEFCKSTEDVKRHTSSGTCRLDSLRQRSEADVDVLELSDRFDQMPQRPAEPV
jgi:hypothetical protein